MLTLALAISLLVVLHMHAVVVQLRIELEDLHRQVEDGHVEARGRKDWLHVGLDELTSNDQQDKLCSCDDASKSPLFLEYALRSGAGPTSSSPTCSQSTSIRAHGHGDVELSLVRVERERRGRKRC